MARLFGLAGVALDVLACAFYATEFLRAHGLIWHFVWAAGAAWFALETVRDTRRLMANRLEDLAADLELERIEHEIAVLTARVRVGAPS